MAAKRSKTRYEGVYVRTTKKGVKVFDITYTRDRKKVWEKVGPEPAYSAKLASNLRGKRLKEIWHGDELPSDRKDVYTFGQVATAYLAWAKEKLSYTHDETRYRLHLAPTLADKLVDRITSLNLERIKRDLLANGSSPATVRQVLALFRAIFNAGLKRDRKGKGGEARGMIPPRTPNPVDEVQFPQKENARARLLSPAEVDSLLQTLAPRSAQAHGLALLAYHTGGRVSELTNLVWADVDLNAKVATFVDTKNGQTRRVPLNATATAYLEKKGPGAPGTRVFPRQDGKPLRWISSTFQRVADELFNQGVTDRRHRVVFHSLRHAFTSRLVAAGVPLRVVMELTGHQSLAMLQRYAHLEPDAGRSAVELLAVAPLAQDKGQEAVV